MERISENLEPESKIYRRIRALTAAALLLGLDACNKPKEKDSEVPINDVKILKTVKQEGVIERTKADEIVENFPEKIPGATDVSIERVPGAKKVLVIINQIHVNPVFNMDKSNPADAYWELHSINEHQKNIEKIIVFLKEKYGIESVATEGISEKDMVDMESEVVSEYDVWHKATMYKYYSQIKVLWDKFPFTQDELDTKFPYLKTATIKMKIDGKIKLLPAESEGILSRVDDELGLNNLLGVDKEGKLNREDVPPEKQKDWDTLFKEREDFVIKGALENSDDMSFVVFGMAHKWKDNILDSNKRSPQKMSLIIITPEVRNESFLTNLLLNSGFTGEEDSWIELHFRDFIEQFEKNKDFDSALFDKGKTEMRESQSVSKLSDEQISKALQIILENCKSEFKK